MKAYKNLLLVGVIVICSLVLMNPMLSWALPKSDNPASSIPGVWQSIIDGASGEGAFFYRMDFKEDGNVTILKQYGGNNVKEVKTWSFDGKNLKIVSQSGAVITDFDEASLILGKNNSIDYVKGSYTGSINRYKSNIAILHWILILVVLMALNELFRRSKYAGVLFYFILPIALLPLWSSYGVSYWFKWVKLFSVVTASAWFILMRFTKLGRYDFAKLVAALFLAANIAEAVTQDFSMGYLPNILNGIAGILSILTLFYGWKGIHADSSREKDLVWPKMTVFWIIAYDIWNFVFVYLNFPGSASAQFMVLLSCTLPSLFIKKGTWLQARAFTLAAWFMYYFTFPRFTESVELLVPRNGTLMLIAGLLSITVNVAYALVYVKKLSNEKKHTLSV